MMSCTARSFPSILRWLPKTTRHYMGPSVGSKCLHSIPKAARNPSCLSRKGLDKIITSIAVQRNSIHSSVALQKEVIPFKLSDIGEGIKEVTIKEWFVKVGDKVSQFDQICEVQSDKASVTITSRYDGVVVKVHHEVDEIALVGSALVDIEVVSSESSDQLEEVQEGDAIQVGHTEDSVNLPPTVPTGGEKILATPAVRRIASEYKVDLKNVQATGRDGRVLKEDIMAYVNSMSGKSAPAPQPSRPVTVTTTTTAPAGPTVAPVVPPKTPIINRSLPDRKEAIKGYTKTMIKTMTAANEIPHFGYCDEINMGELIKLRSTLKSLAGPYQVNITLMPLIMKAASLALTEYPVLNSSLDLQTESITYKGAHNIGVAMDTKMGLVVPNVKNVESKSVLEIALDLQTLQKSGLAGAFKPDDLRGGTFTLSNIGSIGGTYAKPVILPPEVAIVAIGKSQTLPRFDEKGNVIAAHIVNISFSADHRVIDGATAARFCNLWKSYLENPSTMLMHLK